MGFSKDDFEKVDLRIKKITEQTVEQIEIDSELPPTIEQLEDNNRTYSIMAAILFIDIRKSTYLTENSQAKSMCPTPTRAIMAAALFRYGRWMSDTSRLLWKGSRTGLEMWKALTLLLP